MACNQTTSSVASSVTQANQQGMDWLNSYAQMNMQMAQSAAQLITPVMSAWMSWYQSLLPSQFSDLSKSATDTLLSMTKSAMCDIPSVACPPKCACAVTWDASLGETRRTTVKIKNTSKGSIQYTFVPQPFKSCSKTLDISPEVSPQSVTAAPGETVSVVIGATVGELFQAGGTYEAEVLLRGKYERCVKVSLTVACPCDDACTLEQGDIPYHVRPDNWYRHFQCSEPCFEAIAPPIQSAPPQSGNDPVLGNANAAGEVR